MSGRLVEIDEAALRRIARIIGGFSAAQRALDEGGRRRAAGETIAFYQDRKGNAIVIGPPLATPSPLPAREVRG